MIISGNQITAKHTALADGLKAALQNQPKSKVLSAWSALINDEISFEGFGEWVQNRKELTFLTIDTTGVCDLTCKGMCYYHPEIDLKMKFAPEDSIKQAISDASKYLNVNSLVFAGKEPFLNPRRLFDLLNFAGPRENRNFQTGIVTNGRYIQRFWNDLRGLVDDRKLDFIDISLDSGFAEQHDQIRGIEGTFTKTFAATLKVAHELPELRLTIPSVLRRDNKEGIFQLIRLAQNHVKNYQIQPVQPPPYSPMKPLEDAYVINFLRDLETFLSLEITDQEIEVSVELLGVYLLEAEQNGFFSWHELQEDTHGNVFIEKNIGGNRLILTCEVFPLQAWRLARITYEGAYLAHMHFLQTPERKKFVVGYIQEEPITELFRKAISRESHFWQILRSRAGHDCQMRPCWETCFGGWNGAENAYLTGQSLSRQPRLCLKTESDFARLLK